jgi:GAF domain-containing protein
MKKFDPNYLLTLSKLAVTFHEQGKTDEAIALIYQLIEECYPHILERAKTDRTVIYELIEQKNSKDKRLAREAENWRQIQNCRRI